MANKHRGAVDVTLGGKTYVMAPEWEALVEIESLTGLGIVDLSNLVFSKRYGIQHVAAVVFAGIKAGGNKFAIDPTYEGTGRMIAAAGVVNFSVPVLQFLSNALSGGETPKPGEVGAVAAE